MFCLICVKKLVGSESELLTASRCCFGLGVPSLSTTESCSFSDSVAEQDWSLSESSSRSPSNAWSKGECFIHGYHTSCHLATMFRP